MSGTKRISALTELASGSVDEDDILAIVDMSQASVTDKTKHVKVKNLIAVGGRLEIDSFAELATKFVGSSPSSTQQIAATNDIVIWREKGFAYQCVTSGEHFDYTGSGGLKWKVLPVNGRFVDAAFGADGSSFTALQTAVTAAAGAELLLTVQHAVGANELDISQNETRVTAIPGAGLTYTTATNDGLIVSGDDCEVIGLEINAPATFDGTNAQPTYAVINVTGDRAKINRNVLNNVPKVGIYFNDAESGEAIGNDVRGNYPTGSYTGTETGHFGIAINPTGTDPQGEITVSQNKVRGCVQGVFIGNYGATSRMQAIRVFGNAFRSCWNHGVYATNGYGIVVGLNTFVFCQVPIALTGYYHSVVGNTLQTGGSTGTYTDETGISLRDPYHCTVANNTIQGETGTGQTVIALTTLNGTVVRGNTVTGNTILISGAGSSPVIRLGGATCNDLTDNIVANNVCIGTGVAAGGIITAFGAANCPAHGTSIYNNSIVIRSASHGVQLVNLVGAVANDNKIRLEHDAVSATTIAGVQLSACADCAANDNNIANTAAWGTNVTIYGIWELGTSSGNRARNNTFRADPTKLTSSTHYITVSGSGIVVHDTGAGAPNLNAGVGSTWNRTDGGAGTTLYVKESNTDATGWVGM